MTKSNTEIIFSEEVEVVGVPLCLAGIFAPMETATAGPEETARIRDPTNVPDIKLPRKRKLFYLRTNWKELNNLIRQTSSTK